MPQTERPSLTIIALTLGLALLLWAFANTVKSLVAANIAAVTDAVSQVGLIATRTVEVSRETVVPQAEIQQITTEDRNPYWWQNKEEMVDTDPTDLILPDAMPDGPFAAMIPNGSSPLSIMKGIHNFAGEEYE